MQGYISIFTKIIVILFLISMFFLLHSELNKLKYTYVNQIEEFLHYKHHSEANETSKKIAEQMYASCIKNKTYTREYHLKEEIKIEEQEICENECYGIPEEFGNLNKTINRGNHYITIDCKRGEVYD